MNGRAPVYIVSKGRWQPERALTTRYLKMMGVPHYIVVEEQERKDYEAAQAGPLTTILTLDPQYQRDYDTCDPAMDARGLGPGSGPPRNFAWDHAIAQGAAWHWCMDDNIRAFYRLTRNHKFMVTDGTIFLAMEDFVDRYENVVMAGPNYDFFAPARQRLAPFEPNTRIYSCVAPATPVLCADLVWRSAGSLRPGQRIVAFDAEPTYAGQGRNARSYRTAVVERNAPAERPSFVVTTDRGIPVQASDDHPWLVERREPLVRRRKGREAREKWRPGWVTTAELRVGDRIAHLSQPWTRDETHEGGWVAGIYDGEGSCTVRTDNHGIQLAVAQKPGRVMDRLKIALRERGYEFGTTLLESGVENLRLGGGFRGAIRFAGEFAPSRLIGKAAQLWEGRGVRLGQSYEWATVTAIESVGTQAVAEITTSTGTFVTAGYLSHNCNLIRCDAASPTTGEPYRWRCRFNEDTDLSLRMLKDGWCTVLFYAFLAKKSVTQSVAGGYAEVYKEHGTIPKSELLVRMHPDVTKMLWRYGRWHHWVDYSRFREGNKLRRKPGLVIPDGTNDYGMVLEQRRGDEWHRV